MNKIIDLTQINYKPEYPLDLQGWSNEFPIFEDLIKNNKPSIIIEVGTWKGASAIKMANLSKQYNLKSKIYCVDTWLGAEEFWTGWADTQERDLIIKNGYPQIYYQFLSNVFNTKNEDIIIPITNTSHIASIIFKYYNIKANLIYIDGSHDYKDVISDMEDYYNLLEKDGIIFGDDMNWESVRNAVNDFSKSHNIKYELAYDHFWIIKK